MSLAEFISPDSPAEAERVAIAVGLVAAQRGRIKVLDYGGAAGAHFFVAKRIFGGALDLDWRVIETPAMAKNASALKEPGLRFFSDVAAALPDGGVTLAFSSGALPCAPEPRNLLRWLVNLGASHLALVRCELHGGSDDAIFVQEGGPPEARVKHPFTICSRAFVEAELGRRYDVLIRTDKPGREHLIRGTRSIDYYCRRKD